MNEKIEGSVPWYSNRPGGDIGQPYYKYVVDVDVANIKDSDFQDGYIDIIFDFSILNKFVVGNPLKPGQQHYKFERRINFAEIDLQKTKKPKMEICLTLRGFEKCYVQRTQIDWYNFFSKVR